MLDLMPMTATADTALPIPISLQPLACDDADDDDEGTWAGWPEAQLTQTPSFPATGQPAEWAALGLGPWALGGGYLGRDEPRQVAGGLSIAPDAIVVAWFDEAGVSVSVGVGEVWVGREERGGALRVLPSQRRRN